MQTRRKAASDWLRLDLCQAEPDLEEHVLRRNMTGPSQKDQLGSTHFAYRDRRYNSGTAEPGPHSPCPRFWAPGCCSPFSSTGCTLSHRPTTQSSPSTRRPLQRHRKRNDGQNQPTEAGYAGAKRLTHAQSGAGQFLDGLSVTGQPPV